MANIKSSDLIVKAVENEGIEYIFGVPGENIRDFLGSLRTSSEIFRHTPLTNRWPDGRILRVFSAQKIRY